MDFEHNNIIYNRITKFLFIFDVYTLKFISIIRFIFYLSKYHAEVTGILFRTNKEHSPAKGDKKDESDSQILTSLTYL